MRRFGTGSVVAIVLAFFAIACGLTNPFAPRVLCPGTLYCGSPSVPQIVDGGFCCTVVDAVNGQLLPNATVGYLCAFGSSRNPAGCFASLEQARSACSSAPSIVRCTQE